MALNTTLIKSTILIRYYQYLCSMSNIKLFESKKVRTHWDAEKEKWYFSVIDVIEILTDSSIPKRYWSDLKKKLQTEGSQVYEKIVQLKMEASDGKKYATDCL